MKRLPLSQKIQKKPLILFCIVSLGLVLILESCSRTPEHKLVPYRWLLGTWEKKDAGYLSVEKWEMGVSENGDSVMLGWNMQTEGKDTLFQEKLSIRTIGDSVFYVAMPEGSLPTKFFIKETLEKAFTAVNPHHDFPSEITYDSPGPSTLNAVVSGRIRDHKREIRFSWTKKQPI
jgi:hypothetical protein